MAWKSARSLEEVRSEFLSLWAENKKSVSQLCREYGISRKTAYKWRKRKENGGSMKDASRRPKRFPNATPEAVVKKVIEVRKDHPTLGGTKISIMLKRKGMEGVPAGSTVTEILRRHDLLNPRAVAEATHIKRFAKTRPNEMWQADFKGHFTLETGRRCHPLNIIDDCSRYAICSTPLFGETFAEVKPVFISAFRRTVCPRRSFATTEIRGERHKRTALRCSRFGPWSWTSWLCMVDPSIRRRKARRRVSTRHGHVNALKGSARTRTTWTSSPSLKSTVASTTRSDLIPASATRFLLTCTRKANAHTLS